MTGERIDPELDPDAPPQIGDKVRVGYDPETNEPVYAEIVGVGPDGSWELEYDEPTA